jgi:integrase
MKTDFKQPKHRILKTYNNTIFRLYVPKTIDKNNKIEVHFNFLDPSTGKNKQIKKANGIDRYAKEKLYVEQANTLVESLILLLDKGWNPITNEMPDYNKLTANSNNNDCINVWLEFREADLEAKKIKKDELETTIMVMNALRAWLKKNNLLFEKPSIFTKNDIDSFMRAFEKKRGFGKPTYNSYLYRINYLFKFLVEERVLTFNPCLGTFKYKLKGLPTRFALYDTDELATVKEKLKLDPKYKDLELAINLLYTYRLRGAEQLRIKISMFDFENNLLLCPAQVEERGEMVNMTKNGQPAVFKINDDVMQMIKDYLGDNIKNKDYFLFGGHCKPKPVQAEEQLFTGKWGRFRKENDLPKHLQWYALKHTSNSNTLLTTGSDALSIINRHLDNSQINKYTAEMKRKMIIEVDDSHKF